MATTTFALGRPKPNALAPRTPSPQASRRRVTQTARQSVCRRISSAMQRAGTQPTLSASLFSRVDTHCSIIWVVPMSSRLDIFGHEWVPDVVVSGMNRGLNAGRGTLISGTVAAAREGIFQGAKALAVSMHSFSSRMQDPKDYTRAARDLLPILHWFVAEQKWPSGVILNVNIPYENNPGKISRWMGV